MELIVMALILTAVVVGQYIIYDKLGLKKLGYSLTIRRKGGGEVNVGADAADCGIILEVFENEEIEMIEEIDNAKLLPLPWVRTEISCSRWLTFFGSGSAQSKDAEQKGLISGIFTLGGRRKCRRTWRVRCEKRGIADIEDVSLTVCDLFGLVRSARVVKLGKRLRVLPIPADMQAGEMSGDVFIGEIPVRRFVLPDPFMISGAREYTGREPMNRIHWQQSARNGTLMVYNNEFTTERRVLMVLNVQRSYHGQQQRISVPTLEALIKGAAFMLDLCCSTNTVCALAANTPEPLLTEPGEGYAHTMNVLRRLSDITTECGVHIDDFFPELRLADWTDIVFISSFLDERCTELLRALRDLGRSVTILSTDIEETELCEVRHIPRRYYPHESEG